jgi:hypothetical protein
MSNIAKDGLKFVKARARKRDAVGQATYRALELVSDGLGAAGKALRDLGEATQPPARGGAATRPAIGGPKKAAAPKTARKTA